MNLTKKLTARIVVKTKDFRLFRYTETDDSSKKEDKSKNNGNHKNTIGNDNSRKEEAPSIRSLSMTL
jgi:hypothetical protein